MGPPDEVFGTTNEQGEIENEGALQFLLNELAKVDLVPNKGKFQAYLANADSCPHNFPMWLKRPFVITCPTLRNKVTEAIEEAASTKIAADRAQPGEKAAAEAAARTAAHKAEEFSNSN